MTDIYNPSAEPQHSIRSDLWTSMSVPELSNQQELITKKISLMTSMGGLMNMVTYRDMQGSLQSALAALSGLIEYRINNKSTEGTTSNG